MRTIWVVTHPESTHRIDGLVGGWFTFVVACWIGMPIESCGYVNFRARSGGITELREDDHFHNRQVVALDDVHHLDGI